MGPLEGSPLPNPRPALGSLGLVPLPPPFMGGDRTFSPLGQGGHMLNPNPRGLLFPE